MIWGTASRCFQAAAAYRRGPGSCCSRNKDRSDATPTGRQRKERGANAPQRCECHCTLRFS